jgi:hypothetical protein
LRPAGSHHVRRRKPGVTVAHQSGTFSGDWTRGASLGLSRQTDRLSADIHGNRFQISFFAKLLQGLSEHLPFELINTWCYPSIFGRVVTLHDAQVLVEAAPGAARLHADRAASYVGERSHECFPLVS